MEPEQDRPTIYRLRLKNVLKSKECVAIILGYKGHDELVETITGNIAQRNYTLVHLLTNVGLGLHGSYGAGKRQDILTFEEGLREHYQKTEHLRGIEPVLSAEAKRCISEYVRLETNESP